MRVWGVMGMAEAGQEGSGLQQSLALASTASPRWPLAGSHRKGPPPTLPKGGEAQRRHLLPEATQQVSGRFPPKSGGF